MDIIYTLAIVYNFTNLNNNLEVEDKEDMGSIEAESNVITNWKGDKIIKFIYESYCQVISRLIS